MRPRRKRHATAASATTGARSASMAFVALGSSIVAIGPVAAVAAVASIAAIAAVAFVAVLTLAATGAEAADWKQSPDATGVWGGRREFLEEHGLHIDVDYVAETFARNMEAIAYRGNLDIMVKLDTGQADFWKGGTFFFYGEHTHGDGVSDELGLVMPVSFYESENFTQVSELWWHQELPAGVAVRLGKQDANRDFAGPRFGGNFMNSSFGVLPTTPMPSFPAPALGAALFVTATDWLELRSGVYEGAPRVESFAGSAFEKGAGIFATAAAVFEHGEGTERDTAFQVGGWHHTDLDRTGAFAIADILLAATPREDGAPRSWQFFVRGQWEPGADAPDADVYLGGGVTAHGYLGAKNTVGLGMGYVSLSGEDEGFLELFYKWRPVPWFTVEPDVQLYFQGEEAHVLTGLRCKVKL